MPMNILKKAITNTRHQFQQLKQTLPHLEANIEFRVSNTLLEKLSNSEIKEFNRTVEQVTDLKISIYEIDNEKDIFFTLSSLSVKPEYSCTVQKDKWKIPPSIHWNISHIDNKCFSNITSSIIEDFNINIEMNGYLSLIDMKDIISLFYHKEHI